MIIANESSDIKRCPIIEALLYFNRNAKVPSIGKLKLKSRMVKMLPDQTIMAMHRSISPVAASHLVSLQAIMPLHELGTVWPRENTSQVRVLVSLLNSYQVASYFMPSAKFLTYGGIILC